MNVQVVLLRKRLWAAIMRAWDLCLRLRRRSGVDSINMLYQLFLRCALQVAEHAVGVLRLHMLVQLCLGDKSSRRPILVLALIAPEAQSSMDAILMLAQSSGRVVACLAQLLCCWVDIATWEGCK